MSRRMYQVLAARVPRVEPYSIDEMFMDMDTPKDAADLARELRDAVRRIAKIPICVGIGPTKTIAKLANAAAKDNPALDGVCDLRDERDRAQRYERTNVDEVWGIGGRTADKLRALGITTIARFVAMPAREVRSLLTVVGARVQAELAGVSCLALSEAVPARKALAVTGASAGRLRAGRRCAKPAPTTPHTPARSCARAAWSPGAWPCFCTPTRTAATPGTVRSAQRGSRRPTTRGR